MLPKKQKVQFVGKWYAHKNCDYSFKALEKSIKFCFFRIKLDIPMWWIMFFFKQLYYISALWHVIQSETDNYRKRKNNLKLIQKLVD